MSNYVTVKRREGHALASGRRWFYSAVECICDDYTLEADHAEAITSADSHARSCLTVRIAAERDELADAAAKYPRMVDKVVKERDRYKAALESCEAAYAAEVKELKAERQEWRNARYTAQDERDRYKAALEAVEQDLLSLHASINAIASASC